jgi:hypothetical protein
MGLVRSQERVVNPLSTKPNISLGIPISSIVIIPRKSGNEMYINTFVHHEKSIQIEPRCHRPSPGEKEKEKIEAGNRLLPSHVTNFFFGWQVDGPASALVTDWQKMLFVPAWSLFGPNVSLSRPSEIIYLSYQMLIDIIIIIYLTCS